MSTEENREMLFNRLNVRCSCNQSFCLEEAGEHIKQCHPEEIDCPNKCGKRVAKSPNDDHWEKCEKRMWECKLCFVVENETQHSCESLQYWQ